MLNESICLPFRIPDLYGGLAESRGILKCGKDSLVLDLEVKESVFETLRLGAKVAVISITDVAAIEFSKSWFSRWIIIRASRLQALADVPGGKGGEIRLKIHRKYDSDASELVRSVQMELTALGVKKMLDQTA